MGFLLSALERGASNSISAPCFNSRYLMLNMKIIQVRTSADLDLEDPKLEWTFFDGRKELHPPYSIE